MAEYVFRTFKTTRGILVIEDWYKSLPPGAQATFDARREYLCDTPREEWINTYIKRLKESDSIYEIRFKYKNIQYRPLGFFGPNTGDFTFLVPANEKGGKFNPKDAIKMAEERRSAILKGLGGTDVCAFKSNIV